MDFPLHSGYMTYNLLQNYLKFQSYNSQSVTWMKSIALPALTICSTNYLNYTDFKESVNDTAYTVSASKKSSFFYLEFFLSIHFYY